MIRHRIHCIAHKIHNHLLDLDAVHPRLRTRWRKIEYRADAFGLGTHSGNRIGFLNDAVNVFNG